ncbi:sensor histidine kinase [Variovorax sp. PBL-E5]|uniref:sensor histidine kinase n=1 Tax=Variovorax sp. PBL-E5 TaxID=434014 RepID=UPI001319B802|nr:sensor histidine kinase [Variovorax sp. PBL-E5]VTU19638.1 Swarming motility regulation sensor protein RssA [Variovorax sp. PBL-E5]
MNRLALAGPRRIGIRVLLLAMLLPGIFGLLALDTWNDYQAISRVVVDAYDQALIEPVQALNDSVEIDTRDMKPRVNAAFSVEAMFESTRPRFKHLHVGFTRVASNGADTTPPSPEQTLVGVPDLPPPPPGAADDVAVFYDGVYRGYPVRIAALHRTVQISATEALRVLSQAAESTGVRQQALADSWHHALWNDVRVVGVMVVLVWLGVALALRPLERLRRSLAVRAPGDLAPLDTHGVPYEVAPLVDAVNHHIGNQSRLLAAQSRFLADASHQLRTPLAIMLTQAGYALREREPGPMRETLRAIVAQLVRTRRLSEQLLALAHARDATQSAAARPSKADLNAVARDVVLQYLPLAHEKNQDLGWVDARGEAATDEVDHEPGEAGAEPPAPVAPVAANAAELHEALSNLVHNAIKYTPMGGRITVSVRLAGDSAEVEVSDTGPGIPAALRAAAFERFHRTDAGDAAENRGAGLGLAIADAYARRNGGVIELGDAEPSDGLPGGLRATLRLPFVRSNPIRDNTYFGDPDAH